MTEIETVPATGGPEALAGAWSVERHLSPLALFDPNRTSICAQFQAALVDVDGSEARAHLAAARRHLQAAVRDPGVDSGRTPNVGEALRSLCRSLDTIAAGWD